MKVLVLLQFLLFSFVCISQAQTDSGRNFATPRMTIGTQKKDLTTAISSGKNSVIQDNELIFPVPGFQVNLNPDKIKQNPGY